MEITKLELPVPRLWIRVTSFLYSILCLKCFPIITENRVTIRWVTFKQNLMGPWLLTFLHGFLTTDLRKVHICVASIRKGCRLFGYFAYQKTICPLSLSSCVSVDEKVMAQCRKGYFSHSPHWSIGVTPASLCLSRPYSYKQFRYP